MRRDILKNGSGIVEVLVAIGLIGLILAALAGLGNFALSMQGHFKRDLEAANLAAEGLEVAKLLKGEDWAQVGSLGWDTPYHPVLGGSPLRFSLSAGQENIGDFSRQVVFSQVFRDADDNISDAGAIDPATIKAAATVSWSEKGRPYQIELVHYLANWQ